MPIKKDKNIKRVGIFVCECGPNIKNALNMEEVVSFAAGLESVVLAKQFSLLCSDTGKNLIKQEIIKQKLNRVVIAACSPREHEITFRKVAQEAGLNPYLVQIANIREHCAWVIKDKDKATQKAKSIIRAALQRVLLHEPLEIKKIDCSPDVLVIGAGMAGMEAALTAAQKGRKVYLVENSPSIGGRTVRCEKIPPKLECASCILEPKMASILHSNNIQLLTYAEIEEALGYFGNYIIKIRKKARSIDMKACIGCGACYEACPVKVKNEYNEGLNERAAIHVPYIGALPNVPVIDRENCLRFKGENCDACARSCPFNAVRFEEQDEILEIKVGSVILATGYDLFNPSRIAEYGYGKFDDVYTNMEFERILNSNGPTEGKIVLKNNKAPNSIAIINCVGSRSREYNNYCSVVCCQQALMFTSMIKEQLPNTKVTNIYSDMCLSGKGSQEFYDQVRGKAVFIHTASPDKTRIRKNLQGKLEVRTASLLGLEKSFDADMVILMTGIVPNKYAAKVAGIFGLCRDQNGFFSEENTKLAPTTTAIKGVLIAGRCQGPKDIESSVAQGASAAGKVLSGLIQGEQIELEAMVAKINEDLCSGCKICVELCPYKAIDFDKEKKVSSVNAALCKGCGVCSSACPSGAIENKNFTPLEIFTEINNFNYE